MTTKFFSREHIFPLVVLGLLGLFIVANSFYSKPTKESGEISPEVGEESTPIASGKQTYAIMTDNRQNPQIIEVDFDPLDVKIGEMQIIIVKVEDTDNSPITNENIVTATIYTDNGSQDVSFVLKRADGPDVVTTWEGSWTAEDSYDFTYMATIVSANAFGRSSVDISFR